MARGRFVSKSLWGSKKFAEVPERAANLYQCMVHNHNALGRLEADNEALLTIASRYGQRRGWTEESVQADREHLERVGLIRTWGDGGENVYAQIVNWKDHNKIRADREAPNAIPDPPDDNSGVTPDLLRSNSGFTQEDSGVTPAEVQGQVQEQVQGEGQARRSAQGDAASKKRTATKPEILRAYSEAYESELQQPCHLKPRDPEAAQQAADLGTFPSGRDLVPCFREAILRLAAGGYTISLRSVVNNAEIDGRPKKAELKATGEPIYEDFTGLHERRLAEMNGEPQDQESEVRE